MSERDAEIIRASDVGLYAYCAKAWRLKADGHESSNTAELAAGTLSHEAHGARVAFYGALNRAGVLLAALAALALGLWLLTAR